VAFVLAAAAVLCASSLALCGLVVPLSAAGLLAGLAAFGLARLRYGSRRPLPAAGAAASGLVLLAALMFPALLGPTYVVYRQQETEDPGASTRAQPLSGQSGATPVGDAEWADASQAGLLHGGLHVRVVEVSVGPVKGPAIPKKKQRGGKYLVVRLRVQKIEGGNDLASREGKPPSPREAEVRATLTDSAGQAYAQQDLFDLSSAQGRRVSVFPVALVETVFVFEPPPAGVDSLRLEVPGSAWGTDGTFRFRIPPAMIRRTAARPPG
jgi:hypothetical protein